MKSFAPTAIALTLLMFLLVLAAALFFLFQGQQSLKGDLQSANDNVRTLEKQQAEIELNDSAARATLETLEASSTSTAAENVSLTEQLANSDQINATLEAKEDQLTSDLEDANATVKAFESQAPWVTLVEPQADTIVTAGQPVKLVIVASDPTGIESVLFDIGNESFGDRLEEDETIATIPHFWTPSEVGPVTISITATNVNGITSEPYTISLTVSAPATSTPEPTAEPTVEPTPEN